ncbi:hypothetical protein QCD58_005035 [Enterobacter hormaechei]|nr:hypothetical protein [Enterobacter hormaechei]
MNEYDKKLQTGELYGDTFHVISSKVKENELIMEVCFGTNSKPTVPLVLVDYFFCVACDFLASRDNSITHNSSITRKIVSAGWEFSKPLLPNETYTVKCLFLRACKDNSCNQFLFTAEIEGFLRYKSIYEEC